MSYLTVYLLQNTKKCTPNMDKDLIAETLMELLMNGVPKECDFFYNMVSYLIFFSVLKVCQIFNSWMNIY